MSIMHSYFKTLGIITKYLTGTNMPTAQLKKRAQKKEKVLISHCPDKRGSTVC